MCSGLALQVVCDGVAWLIDRQIRAARQLNRGEQPSALVAGWMGGRDALGGQVRQRLLDVVTYQVELVLARPVCGMHGDLGRGQLEDQPATAGVAPANPSTSRMKTRSASASVLQRMMCAPLIMFPFPSPGHRPFRCVILCLPLRASGQHPRIVTSPDVEGVDLPSAQTVIFIPRARPCSMISFSLQRHPTPCTSRLQEKVTLISHLFYRCG